MSQITASQHDSDSLYKVRHSAEHVLMQAMQRVFGADKFFMAMGPATDEGFYFDFEPLNGFKVSEEDFPVIEAEMAKIVKENLPITRSEITIDEAKKMFASNPYKLEWLESIQNRDEAISIYRTGNDFVDLCAGPHVRYTTAIKAFKLLSIAGAYWHGDEKNKMLTRIYGTAFESKSDLEAYLLNLEEIKKRDHRKLGKELDLFCFSDLVGPGLVMWTPKGTIIKRELYNYIVGINKKYGAQEVSIPHMARIGLYETSGHAQKFKDELFTVVSHHDIEFVLKPVNCPHHTQIYASKPRSYKDLPIRYIESTQQHRDEKPGEIGGLQRTRSFEVDDGHTFCTVDQIKDEAINIAKIVEEFYKTMGLWDGHWVSLSVRNPKTPGNYIGDENDWKVAERMIQEISDELGLDGKVMEGEAALYGPKIDFMRKEIGGKQTQLATIQIDFAMSKRFGLEYTDENGQAKTPVMLHRAILGSYERFIMALIERFGGAFPTWLSPVQAKLIPITDAQHEFANQVLAKLKEEGIRVEIDDRSEKMQSKIRDAQMQKIPYMLVIGGREADAGTVAVRQRDGQDLGAITVDEFIAKIREQITTKSLNLIK